MRGACDECDQRWRDYTRATAEHVRLLSEQQAAVADGMLERSEDLESRIETANRSRIEAQKRVTEHAWAAHSQAGGTRP